MRIKVVATRSWRYMELMITPAQIRAARALINMKQADLAAAAGVSLGTVNNIEREISDPRASTLLAISRVLENAGVTFDLSSGSGPGVRLLADITSPEKSSAQKKGASEQPPPA